MAARPVVKFVAVLPPPHTGMTAVSAAMEVALGEALDVRPFVLRRAPGMSDRAWSTRKHLGLIAAMMKALRTMPRAAPIYMVLDSGGGAWGSAVLALMARLVGSPLVIHHHVFSYFTGPSAAARLFFQIAGHGALHLTLCGCMVERLRAQYGADRTALVLSNPAFVEVAASPRPRSRLLRVGFLGNVTRDKGVGLFMETVRRLSAQGIALEAHIAGPVRDEAVAAEIAAFVAEDPERRAAPGPVYGPDKQAFLDGIDVLLFPSQYINEAQPVTIYEALAAGAPALATARGCVPEQLPGDWVYLEAEFATLASARLAAWAADPEAFTAAAASAAGLWTTALTRSQTELETAVDAVRRLAPA